MVIKFLAPSLREIVAYQATSELEEIRLRLNRPLMIKTRTGFKALSAKGTICTLDSAHKVTAEEFERSLQIITKNSWYAWEPQIQNGYLTVPGGHRVGIGGQAVFANGMLKTIKNISSLNLRQAKQVVGAADRVINQVVPRQQQLLSTLIVSPPGCGKTTLLRDLARQIANGGWQAAIIDERSEIAASYQGQPQLDVGLQTDILDGYDKLTGAHHALRALAPDVVITDEIGHESDAWILSELARSGVKIIASCHGNSLEQIKERKALKDSLSVFELVVILSRRRGPGTIESVLRL